MSQKERSKRYHDKLKEEGKCIMCRQELDREGIYCTKCCEKLRPKAKARRDFLKKNHVCPTCGKNTLFGDEKGCLDCKTGEQVLDDVRRDVYVLVPKEFGGGHIKEECYDGYGRFGGHDIYDLVVDWNMQYLEEYRKDKSFKCNWLQKQSSVEEAFEKFEKREIGISIACYDEDNASLKYPIKITHDATAVYEYCVPSLVDPNQGWCFEDDEEDCYEENYAW